MVYTVIKFKRVIKGFMRWMFCKEGIHFGQLLPGEDYLHKHWNRKKLKECYFCEEVYTL